MPRYQKLPWLGIILIVAGWWLFADALTLAGLLFLIAGISFMQVKLRRLAELEQAEADRLAKAERRRERRLQQPVCNPPAPQQPAPPQIEWQLVPHPVPGMPPTWEPMQRSR